MKALLLSAVLLASPAITYAGHHHGGGVVVIGGGGCYSGYGGYRGYYGGGCGSRYSYGYARPYCYSRPVYYGGYGGYYGGYGYGGYGYGGGYYGPSVSLSYTSVPRVYDRARYADNDSSLEVDVQRALKRRGYYRGSIDGDIGPASREAIRAYQSEHGLSPTGRIDSTLLRSLNV
jgi:hypothetical protein